MIVKMKYKFLQFAHWLHLPKALVTISLKKDMNNLEKNQ